MDAKEQFLIEQLTDTILSGTFSERDVLALLIVLRRHAKQENVIREFGDFVAHREKDRGWLQKYVLTVKKGLESGELPINIPISNRDIQADLNQILRSLHIPEIGEELSNQITLCIISLLQSVQIKIENLPSDLTLKLYVGIGRSKIWLLGEAPNPRGDLFYFPILFGQNRYIPDIDFEDPPIKMQQIVEAFSVNGVFLFEPRDPKV
jgi:hypothetical protein